MFNSQYRFKKSFFLLFLFLRHIYSIWGDVKKVKRKKMKTEEIDKTDTTKTTELKFVNETLNGITEKKWQKNCPKCGNLQFYVHKRSLMDSIRYGCVCNICKDVLRKEKTITKNFNKKYEKTCLGCGVIQSYKSKWSLDRSIVNNALCKKCVLKGRLMSEHQKEFLRKRVGKNNPMYGKTCSIETRKKMSISRKGKPGKPLTEETKHKLRLYRANWVNEFAGGPQYNPIACKFFDELNIQNQWNLQHAENGGEFYVKQLGYFLDAYDKERNIAVEYDEPKHFTVEGNLKEKDVKRQERITSLLKCKFFRYNELTKEFKSFT